MIERSQFIYAMRSRVHGLTDPPDPSVHPHEGGVDWGSCATRRAAAGPGAQLAHARIRMSTQS